MRDYRDELERAGRSPATIAKQLSALRRLAAELSVDDVHHVRSSQVGRGTPQPLSAEQFARLLRMPDRRTTAGKRDLALLHLLGSAGLRRAEACAVLIGMSTSASAPATRGSAARAPVFGWVGRAYSNAR